MNISSSELKEFCLPVFMKATWNIEGLGKIVEKFPELSWLDIDTEKRDKEWRVKLLDLFRSRVDEVAEFLLDQNSTNPFFQKLIAYYYGLNIVQKMKTEVASKSQPAVADPEIEATVFQMGKSFGKALLDVGKSIIQNKPILVDPLVQDARMAICAGTDIAPKCEFYTSGGRCAKCGCNMKFKSRLETSSCPMSKW